MPLTPGRIIAAFLFLFVCTLAACTRVSGDDGSSGLIEGRPSVVDGDGLEIDGVKIRIYGIDAPEVGQYCRRADGARWRCGQYATVELDRLLRGKEVVCAVKTRDSYGRSVAVCKMGELDIARHQVTEGWAVAYRRYSKDYIAAEEAAKKARRGIWRGNFELPWLWRQRMRDR